ncbi:hypothetical protein [Pseudomonas sp.]|uniref:hypothetical protein n=1 Tax=Pseudomonas sp. TaxID=306 RepID=UPI003FD88B0F
MSNHPHYLAWIDESETGLAAWIRRYLTKRGESLPDRLLKGSELVQLKKEIERWATTGPDADTTWKRLRQMNEAWTQQKIRDKRKKNKQKACSFVLSSAAQKKLQQLTTANEHGTAADCLEWLLQNSAAQLKAAGEERKETKERHNEELRGTQSEIDALGHLLGHVLYEFAILSSTTLTDGKKTRQTLMEPQEGEIENAYEIVRKNALVRVSGLTHLSQKRLTGLIKRPSNEQIAISVALIVKVDPTQTCTSNIEPSNSSELNPLKTENYGARTTTWVQPDAPPEGECAADYAPSSITGMASPNDAVNLPGEPETIELHGLQHQKDFFSNMRLQRKRLSTVVLKLPPELGSASEFEGLI